MLRVAAKKLSGDVGGTGAADLGMLFRPLTPSASGGERRGEGEVQRVKTELWEVSTCGVARSLFAWIFDGSLALP